MEREEPSCTGWADVSVSALRHDLPRDVLSLNLQKVRVRLAAQVVPLTREEDHVVLDEVLRALVEPRMLHHRSRRLQGLVLACLREALRVYRLDESQGIDTSGDQKAPKAAKEPARPSVANPPARGLVEQGLAAPPPLGGEILLTASGELCQLIREKDWSSTPWGPLSEWPQALKIALAVCLFSRFPLVIYWGPDYRMLYNDAYRPIMGTKHPKFLGEAYQACWPTIWDQHKVMLGAVVESRKPTWVEDHCNFLRRYGYVEETYFTFSYSPLFLDDGRVGGLYTAVTENTLRVISERQVRGLRDLAARGVEANSVKDAVHVVGEVVATTAKYDVAFASIYLLDGRSRRAVLADTVGGLQRGSLLCPEVVTLRSTMPSSGEDSTKSEGDTDSETELGGMWCSIFQDVVAMKDSRLLDLVPFGSEVPPCRAWGDADDDRTRACMVLPLMSHSGNNKVFGLLVAGVNPRHELEDSYRIFLNLFATNVASIIVHATSREEEVQRVQALAELDEAKTTFFSNISHEFRTPLTLMLGPLEDMLRQAERESEKGQLGLIHRNALRLYKLVNSLLDFSRLEAGRARANFEPVGLVSFTQGLVSIFRSTSERAGLGLVVECEEELEEPVYVDKDMWEKVVLNLLSNALKFTAHGHIHVGVKSVSDGVVPADRCAELMVKDTGIGIPEEDLPLLGNRFHRVETPGARSHEGTGIGLALVFELVRLHGGRVSVESQLGHGTTFRVRIPFGVAHLPADQIRRTVCGFSQAHPPKPTAPLSPRTVASVASPPLARAPVGEHGSGRNTEEIADGEACAEPLHYSKTVSWWLPSIAIAAVAPQEMTTTSRSPSPRSPSYDLSPRDESCSPSSDHSSRSSPASGSSPEIPSPRLRTAASFSISGSPSPGEAKRPSLRRRSKGRDKEKVLLVDDNFDMREYVARLLSPKYEVISVSNGLEALSVLRSSPQAVDLVLTDVMMPFLDGFGLLKEIRARHETHMMPVIMLSARAGEEASAEGLAEGADDYLTKPFTARELLSRVSSHLKLSRMRTRAARTESALRMELQERKERLENILASIQDAFVALDSCMRCTYANNNAAAMLCAKKEDMIGRKVWRHLSDTADGAVARNLERAMTEKVDLVFEYYFAERDLWYESRMYPGSDGGVSIFTIDVTARKKDKARLALLAKVGRMLAASVESHLPSLLQSALDTVGGSVVADWCIMDVVAENGSLQRMATPNAETHLWQLHQLPPSSATADEADEAEATGADEDRYHAVVQLSNGERVGIECGIESKGNFVMYVLEGRGRVFGTWLFAHSHYQKEDKVVCEELARRAGMAIDNAQLYHAADSANQAKDSFLAALSHELRTPLTPALLLSESLLTEGALSERAEESIQMIHESVELEVRLIDDLLDFTKISRNKLKLAMQEVAVHEVLGRTLQIVGHEISAKKLTVSTHLHAPIDHIIGDPARLKQVFANIIKNGTKFTPEGGAITVTTSNVDIELPRQPEANPEDDEEASNCAGGEEEGPEEKQQGAPGLVTVLRVAIADTGIGIESHVMPHLFQAFEQGDTSITARFGGLGLGLSISRALTEMHSGKLEAFSEGKNQGATFVVDLPIATATSRRRASGQTAVVAQTGWLPPRASPDNPPKHFGEPLGLPMLKVLLVEDNKSTLMIMSRLLRQKLNFNVLAATCVADALTVAAEEKGVFDLVISDVGLPDGTGHDLMRALKATYNLKKGIALSGYGLEEDVRRTLEAGFDVHLTKPVHFATLSAAIHDLLFRPSA